MARIFLVHGVEWSEHGTNLVCSSASRCSTLTATNLHADISDEFGKLRLDSNRFSHRNTCNISVKIASHYAAKTEGGHILTRSDPIDPTGDLIGSCTKISLNIFIKNSVSISMINFSVAYIVRLLESPRRCMAEKKNNCHMRISRNCLWNRNVFRCWRNTGREGKDWMSSGKELQRTDAATGKKRRPMADWRNDGPCSRCDDDEWSIALDKVKSAVCTLLTYSQWAIISHLYWTPTTPSNFRLMTIAVETWINWLWPFKVIQGRWLLTYQKSVYDFLLVDNFVLSSFFHRFRGRGPWNRKNVRPTWPNFDLPTTGIFEFHRQISHLNSPSTGLFFNKNRVIFRSFVTVQASDRLQTERETMHLCTYNRDDDEVTLAERCTTTVS